MQVAILRLVLAAVFLLQLGQAQNAIPVILISVDTLRADHLSCYDAKRKPTPHIDALAKHGTLFSQATSAFPLTLPSHVSLLTSTYPFANGVEDNGVALKADAATTLASVLKGAGYHTGAFVASFVLDRRFGLDRGFDVYDGPVDTHGGAPTSERKRPGAQVTAAALRWLDRNSSAPFFLFLHLYDLHLPYDLPREVSLRHGESGYAAELAYEDQVLGAFFAALEQRKIFDRALIVFTSDHGEGLGDHEETTHGFFVYQSTLHVPLIVHWPTGFKRAAGERVEQAASLVDVAPTILDAVSVTTPGQMTGRSLLGAGQEREVYSESVYARDHFGCAGLRSLRTGKWKYIAAPKPELYDLASDAGETHNVYEQQRTVANGLAVRLDEMRKTAPAAHAAGPTADTAAALRSLGYLSGTSNSHSRSRIDPKDRIGEFEQYLKAVDLASAGQLGPSNAILNRLREKVPDVADVWMSLGLNQQRADDYAAAEKEFQAAVERAPEDAQAHFELGFCQFHLGKQEDAIAQFKATLGLAPWYARALEALAQIYLQKNDFTEARGYLEKLLAVDPASYTAHYNLGIFAAIEQKWAVAQHHFEMALQAEPTSREAHASLGKVFEVEGESAKAAEEYRAAQR